MYVCVLFIPVSLALDDFGDVPASYQHLGKGVGSWYWCDFSVTGSCMFMWLKRLFQEGIFCKSKEFKYIWKRSELKVSWICSLKFSTKYSMPQVETSGGLFYAANLGVVDIMKQLLAKLYLPKSSFVISRQMPWSKKLDRIYELESSPCNLLFRIPKTWCHDHSRPSLGQDLHSLDKPCGASGSKR